MATTVVETRDMTSGANETDGRLSCGSSREDMAFTLSIGSRSGDFHFVACSLLSGAEERKDVPDSSKDSECRLLYSSSTLLQDMDFACVQFAEMVRLVVREGCQKPLLSNPGSPPLSYKASMSTEEMLHSILTHYNMCDIISEENGGSYDRDYKLGRDLGDRFVEWCIEKGTSVVLSQKWPAECVPLDRPVYYIVMSPETICNIFRNCDDVTPTDTMIHKLRTRITKVDDKSISHTPYIQTTLAIKILDKSAGLTGWSTSASPLRVSQQLDVLNNTNGRNTIRGKGSGHSSRNSINATANISLSGEGMHRTLHYNVKIDIPGRNNRERNLNQLNVATTEASGNFSQPACSGRIVILQHLSEAIYIDVDDPSPEDDFDCHVESMGRFNRTNVTTARNSMFCKVDMLKSSTTIDVEQPSFASPQHLVAFEILVDGQEWCKSDLSDPNTSYLPPQVQLSFSVTVHVRYQMPIKHPNEDGVDVDVRILRPTIYSAMWVDSLRQIYCTDDPIEPDGRPRLDFQDRLRQDWMFCAEFSPALTGAALVTQTAAPLQSDLWFVVSATLIASVVGVIIMAREICRIGMWR